MAVSEAFVKAGKLKAKAQAIRLIKLHVPTLIDSKQTEARLAAQSGLDFARELGRQHGFEADVKSAIVAAFDLLSPPSPVAAELEFMERLLEQQSSTPVSEPPRLEAAE